MSWTKNGALISAVAVVCYGMLIVGDWAADKIMSGRFDPGISSGARIANEQKEEKDELYRQRALAEGYVGVIWPDFFDNHDSLSTEMLRLNIGAIGSTPNAKTYYCNEGYGLVTYVSDRFGLRNEDTKWDKPIDTIFIGDSFTHGACVFDSKTLPSVYEKMSGEATVNLGFGSNHPRHYAALAKIFTPKVNPKNVFMVFYANDKGSKESTIFDLHVAKELPFFDAKKDALQPRAEYGILHQFAREKDLLAEKTKTKQSSLKRIVNKIKYRMKLPTISKLLGSRLNPKANLLGDSAAAIKLAKDLCDAYGCSLKVVYMPNSEFWRPDAFAKAYREQLELYAAELGVDFFDGTKVLDRGQGSADYALEGPHLSPSGYRKMAELLLSN